MSYFNVCVLAKKDGSFEEAMQRASDMLATFDINKKVEPYKFYISEDEILNIADHYKIDSSNLVALAEKLEAWNCEQGCGDEKGLYCISTKNPDGHLDGWCLIDEVRNIDRGRLLFGEGGEEKNCKAVVTPEGEWFSGPWIYNANLTKEQEGELNAWNKKVVSLLDEYRN